MIKLSANKGSACRVEVGDLNLVVFPETPAAGERCIVSSPIEDLQDKVISWPGEYDFDGIFLRGIGQEEGKQVSYSCSMDGMRLAFVNAPIVDWSDAELEKLGNVDVLIIAAQDEKKLKALVENVDPRIVVLFDGDKDLTSFVKACGASEAETTNVVKLQSSSLPADSRQVKILQA